MHAYDNATRAGRDAKSASPSEERRIAVTFKRADGEKGVEGITRVNDHRAVPGGNGAWNVDAYGRLYHDYLIITYPHQPDLGPRLIPASRIVEIQFGDGGIKQVNR